MISSISESVSNGSAAAPRQRDRRRGWESVVSTLSQAVGERNDPSRPRAALEEALRRLLPVQSMQIREQPGRWNGRPSTATGSESVVVEIPDRENSASLEATFAAGATASAWDVQMLGLTAHLAVLVMEIERARLQLARAGIGAPLRARRDGTAPLVGRTPALRDLRTQIERVARTDFTVLIEGESGVGKELVAHEIHELSRRRAGPFVAINCAALVETLLEAELFGIEDRTATGVRGRRGKFEHADGGTLFLDEVSDLSLSAQAKLLRAIQDLSVERVGGQGTHRVDIRIIAATNRALSGLVQKHLFRPDLFFRLSGVEIRVPPLRERRADIIELANHFIERHRAIRRLRLSTAAADALLAYDWPGNVRELERLMERTIALSERDVVELDDLPHNIRGDVASLIRVLGHNRTMRAWGSRYARLVLERCDGNKRQACRVLGISYHTLNAYLRYPFAEPPVADENWSEQALAEDALNGSANCADAAEM